MFVRVDLVRPFTPVKDNTVYGMDQLVDMAKYPKAESITIFCITDSNVGGSPIKTRAVGSELPDPGSVSLIGSAEPEHDNTVPGVYNKKVHTIEMSKAAFPFYGVVFCTGATAPSSGQCWAYAYVWWPGEV